MQHSLICAVRWSLYLPMVWIRARWSEFLPANVTQMATFDEFYDAYKKQMEYCISLLVNADNAIDVAHAKRCPLPFLSSMIDDCIKRGKTVQEGGAVYNFTRSPGLWYCKHGRFPLCDSPAGLPGEEVYNGGAERSSCMELW